VLPLPAGHGPAEARDVARAVLDGMGPPGP
jgi:hypothetical protein